MYMGGSSEQLSELPGIQKQLEVDMSRLSIITQNSAQRTVEELYKDLERRIVASPPGYVRWIWRHLS